MSSRTIIVGILAAVCGICATVGVMSLNINKLQSRGDDTATVMVAKTNIELGEQVDINQLTELKWKSAKIPEGAVDSPDQIVGKYCVAPILAGEVISVHRLGNNPTTLLPAAGLRAYAIEAASASTNVGRNLVPGNRVDIIWQTDNKLKNQEDPISVRLLQNVKILAVGQVQGETDDRQKSITLEVKPTMDENLAFAQAYGRLTLSLRNPGDDEGVEPVETNRFKDVLADLGETSEAESAQPPAWEALIRELGSKIAGLEQQINASSKDENLNRERDTLARIPEGLQAVTIQTPDESNGLAGILEPGDRVDLQLTLQAKFDANTLALTGFREHNRLPSEKLIENIEVLAVDANIYNMDGEGNKEVPRSVTLIVMEEMVADINRAAQLGALTLTLRGLADSSDGPPRTVMSVEDFVSRHMPQIEEPVARTTITLPPVYIRTLRGPSPQVLPFKVRDKSDEGIQTAGRQ